MEFQMLHGHNKLLCSLVAFTVDPLYHQTSAQFDEGGAKGLLLNNLGVYGNCQVLFDSLEVPGKCMLSTTEWDSSATIDISFARGTPFDNTFCFYVFFFMHDCNTYIFKYSVY